MLRQNNELNTLEVRRSFIEVSLWTVGVLFFANPKLRGFFKANIGEQVLCILMFFCMI